MIHIEEFHIQQFRGVRDLKLTGLGQFNLLVGGNNSGKTTVLEAVDLHCHPLDILKLISIAKRRDSESVRLPRLDSVQWMFPMWQEDSGGTQPDISIASIHEKRKSVTTAAFKVTKVLVDYHYPHAVQLSLEDYPRLLTFSQFQQIQSHAGRKKSGAEENLFTINAKAEQKELKAFEIRLKHRYVGTDGEGTEENTAYTITDYSFITQDAQSDAPSIPTQFVTPVDHRSLPISSEALTNTILSGDQGKLIELLRLFDSNIEGIQILSPDGNTPAPYIQHKELGHTPVSVFGDGIRRALTLALAVVKCRNGILLIDEIETAVYVKALDKVFTWLVEACKTYNVQLIATTHSLEAVDAVLAAMDGSSLVTYKLDQKNNTTVAKRFSGEELHDIRYEFGLDVR